MKSILVVGATGTIGRAVAAALGERHQLIRAGRRKADEQVDLNTTTTRPDAFGLTG